MVAIKYGKYIRVLKWLRRVYLLEKFEATQMLLEQVRASLIEQSFVQVDHIIISKVINGRVR